MKISPPLTDFYADPEGNFEGYRVFHFPLNQPRRYSSLGLGSLQDKLIVNL
jgi:hypothetical protein